MDVEVEQECVCVSNDLLGCSTATEKLSTDLPPPTTYYHTLPSFSESVMTN